MAGDEGQQIGRRAGTCWKGLSVESTERGEGVADEGIDEGLAGGLVVPVARGLADSVVLVVAHEGGADHRGESAGGLLEGDEQLADGGPQLGDGVLGGHGVIERGRVEHPGPALHRPGVLRQHLGVFEEAPGTIRGPQAVALTDERGRMEGHVAGVDAAGRLPAQVEAETVGRLGVAQAFEGLEQHHSRHHPGRDGRSSPHRLRVEIGEVVVTEELVAVIGQEPVDRTFLQPITEDLPRVLEALLGL